MHVLCKCVCQDVIKSLKYKSTCICLPPTSHPPPTYLVCYIRWFLFRTQIWSIYPLLKTLQWHPFSFRVKIRPHHKTWRPVCSGPASLLNSSHPGLAFHHSTNLPQSLIVHCVCFCSWGFCACCFLFLKCSSLLHCLINSSLSSLSSSSISSPEEASLLYIPIRSHLPVTGSHIFFTVLNVHLYVCVCYEVCLSGI